MRKVVLFFALILLGTLSFAGPFGLSMGMSLEEVTEACGGIEPERIENDDRYYIKPIKSHPSFEEYIAWIDENKGLYYVKANTEDIYVSRYGTELKNEFYDLVGRLSKSYGKPTETVDKLVEKPSLSIYTDESYWLETLKEGSRKLEAAWRASKLPDELVGIYLFAKENNLNYKHAGSGFVSVEYEFKNRYEIESKEDDVL